MIKRVAMYYACSILLENVLALIVDGVVVCVHAARTGFYHCTLFLKAFHCFRSL